MSQRKTEISLHSSAPVRAFINSQVSTSFLRGHLERLERLTHFVNTAYAERLLLNRQPSARYSRIHWWHPETNNKSPSGRNNSAHRKILIDVESPDWLAGDQV